MTESKVAIEAEFTLLRHQMQGMKKRKLERFRCPIAAMGKLQFPGRSDRLDVWVINLSKGGIGINLSHPLDSGAEVTISLKSDDQKTLFQKNSRVVHSTQQIDGSWRVGCEFFDEMSEDELDTLL
jgi:PilZ domain